MKPRETKTGEYVEIEVAPQMLAALRETLSCDFRPEIRRDRETPTSPGEPGEIKKGS